MVIMIDCSYPTCVKRGRHVCGNGPDEGLIETPPTPMRVRLTDGEGWTSPPPKAKGKDDGIIRKEKTKKGKRRNPSRIRETL